MVTFTIQRIHWNTKQVHMANRLLPPSTKLRQGNVFYTCLSFCSPGGSATHTPCIDTPGQTPPLDRHPPLDRYTPVWTGTYLWTDTPSPLDRHPFPLWTDNLLGRNPYPGRHPLGRKPPWQTFPLAQCMLGYGQQAGATHPTGMHSCIYSVDKEIFFPENSFQNSFNADNRGFQKKTDLTNHLNCYIW